MTDEEVAKEILDTQLFGVKLSESCEMMMLLYPKITKALAQARSEERERWIQAIEDEKDYGENGEPAPWNEHLNNVLSIHQEEPEGPK